MGKGWTKGGESQAMPSLCPCLVYEGWGKGGRKAGEARECPAYAHAKGMKGGEKVDKRWGKPGNPRSLPILCV
ncbi:hypothetical protein CYL18_09580 [Pradoshia eiseniae]|uniref:Uncharacterized protein n=1 Tax=Pradoshia eiseniae TaxID=2064768 RepID=A0A2S7N0I4_9BACI|nr:hypothetical protein CYL18_09580 [Pradoshia eiseniae]